MEIQIDKYLVETLMSTYKDIDNTCLAIDRYLLNVGSSTISYNESVTVLYDNLIQQIIRKNKLIKFKEVFMKCVQELKMKDRQVYEALTKLKNTKKKDICFLLNIEQRTFYRRIENLYKNLADLMQKSKDKQLILDVCTNEYFINSKYEPVKRRRQSYTKTETEEVQYE